MKIPETRMFSSHYRSMIRLLVCFGMLLLLTACGQKGDLYHPEDEQQSSAGSPPSSA